MSYYFSPNPGYGTGFEAAHADNWRRWLEPYSGRPNIHALEIGTYEGMASLWLMDNVLTHPSCTITCIDCWSDDVNDGMGGSAAYETFQSNIVVGGRPWSWHVLRGRSDVGLIHFRLKPADDKYLICYIDGGHDAQTVLNDSVLAWPLVASGGTIIWDDYQWPGGDKPTDRPHIAIDAFLRVYDGAYDVLSMDYQVAIRKR
jgi:hypothetical protein